MKSLSQPAVNMNRMSYGILRLEQNKLSIAMCERTLSRFNIIRKEKSRQGWLKAMLLYLSFFVWCFHLNKCGNVWSPSLLSNVLCCVLRKMKWQSTKCIDVSGGRGQNEVIKRALLPPGRTDTAYKLDFHRRHLKCISNFFTQRLLETHSSALQSGGFVLATVWEHIFLLFFLI